MRTGVTVVVPHEGNVWSDPVYAAYHRLNGNGEMTGLPWLEEVGLLHSPVGDHQHPQRRRGPRRHGRARGRGAAGRGRGLGAARRRRDLGRHPQRRRRLPRDRGARQGRLPRAAAGPVAEGSVGGGTGMVCHDFKGGIGTASRRRAGDYTVGVLVQANHGRRERFSVNGVPVGLEIGVDVVPGTDRTAPPASRRGLDHRRGRDRRAAAAAAVPAAGAAGVVRRRPDRRGRRELQRRPVPRLRHRQPRLRPPRRGRDRPWPRCGRWPTPR